MQTTEIMKQWFKDAIANPWLRQYILIGYAGKGVVYFFIGILTVQAAILSDKKASGTYHTLSWIADKPLGKVLLCLIAFSLIGYVLRRIFQTVLITEYSNPSILKSTFKRAGYLMSGFSYAGVAYSALNIIFELGEYDDTIEDIVNQLFEQPIGEWLTLLGGIGVTTVGISYVYGAYSGSYISDFQPDDIHKDLDKLATRMGKLGVAARGVAFILTGAFLIEAAISGNSELAGGLENAFNVLATKPFGWLWLGLIGLGLICYGLYMFVAAIYRRYTVR